ncbi:MAG: four helix bundle protein [Candidatus Liptonbacteria bacterium]|nr:four helix bundle protein [Candidatus Liptonbacteria bacterium]
MKNFKDLLVWQKSIELVVSVYTITKGFPTEEKYGLTNQLRRAAISIPSNIAEGNMRSTGRDFKQFVAIARGPCSEVETQNIIAERLGYIQNDDCAQLSKQIDELSRMLGSFYASLSKQ